ncbi:dynactin subunit 2 [Brevipalpus obovatus]|uniref:dynactin subunit 2 n=1 Tax=Brevipalpus obovatus TaxID=246614 RepID=UPI003D9EBE05
MSTVSKYANLPGIAWDQPDVFETGDLPEADQSISNRVGETPIENNEDIEVVNIDAKKSFQLFESIEHGEFVSESSDETPLQVFRRLESEVTSLTKHLECVQKTREGRGQDFGSIIANVSELEEKMKACRLALQEIPDENLEADQTRPSSTGTSAPPKTTGVKDPLSKLASLENRVKKLEGLLDYDDDKLTSIFYNTNEKNLSDAVRSISARMSQLDATSIDQVDQRVGSLIRKLNQLAEKKSIMEEAQDKKKITEVYEMVSKLEKNMSIIVEVAARLNILSGIEEEAMNFSEAFSNLNQLQNEIEKTISHNSAEVNAMKESFHTNFVAIKELMDSIDKRVTSSK